MAISIQKSLLQLSTQSNAAGTNPAVRGQLEIYSTTEIDSLVAAATGTDWSPQIDALSGAIDTNTSDISALQLDLDNLDSSLTAAIVDLSGDVSHGPATASAVPSAFSAQYYITMKVANGSTFYVPAMSAAW